MTEPKPTYVTQPEADLSPLKSTVSNARRIMRHVFGKEQAQLVADILGVNVTHVYLARKRAITPTLMSALVRHGYLQPKNKRRRFACDVPPGCDAERFRAEMRKYVPLAAAAAKVGDGRIL